MYSRYIHNVLEMYESESSASEADGGDGSAGGDGSRPPVAEDSTRDTQLFVSA